MSTPISLVAAPPAGAGRVTLRVESDGQAREVIGHPLGTDGPHLIVLPADAGPEWVVRSQITHRRDAGPRPVRPVSTPLDVERVSTLGWPGVERFRFGGWLLRAGGGWTGRANSCLVAGDPGVPIPDALDAVEKFYRHRDLPGRLQITLDAAGAPIGQTRDAGPTVVEVDAAADAAGWQASETTHVLVADFTARPPGPASLPDGVRPVWTDEPTEQWRSLLRGGEGTDPRVPPVLTAAPARYLTLIDDTGPLAVGRGATAEDWLGISCVEVHPDARRRGLGRAVTQLLIADAKAPYGYLQVVDGNEPALALYAPLGFEHHHGYRYRTLVGE